MRHSGDYRLNNGEEALSSSPCAFESLPLQAQNTLPDKNDLDPHDGGPTTVDEVAIGLLSVTTCLSLH